MMQTQFKRTCPIILYLTLVVFEDLNTFYQTNPMTDLMTNSMTDLMNKPTTDPSTNPSGMLAPHRRN